MSFATRLCASLFGRGARLLAGTEVPQLPPAARNFHMMLTQTGQIGVGASPAVGILPAQSVGGIQRLLTPLNSLLTQVAGFKVKGRLRRRCKDCYFVTRQERRYVICPTHPRHKQMAMKKRDYKSWILTHATQSKIRPY